PMVVLRTHQPTAPAAVLDVLSKREVQVVALMADGLSNKQIARRLFIALPTVKDHVHRMLKKTALSNRAALAAAFKGHTLVDRDAADSTQPPPGQPLRFGN
ncbi:MAG: LuxR C-terminal-related transcriptional regulator, partial [Phycisphaerae bacterium]